MAARDLTVIQGTTATQERQMNLILRIFLYIVGFFLLDIVSEVIGSGIADKAGWAQNYGQFVSSFFSIPLILGFTYLFRRRLDKRPWSGMALASSLTTPLLAVLGLTLGCALIGGVFAIESALGWIQVTMTAFAASTFMTALPLVLAGLVFAGATGFIEELGFRGYIFQNLGNRFPIWAATLITGLVFGLLHFGEIRSGGVIFLVQAVLITTMFVVCRLRTGTLWLAIGVHAGWNWTESNIIDFSNSDPNALVHLKFVQPLTAIQPEFGFAGVLMELVAIGLIVWWPYRTTWRLSLRSRLDDEGHYSGGRSSAKAA
jgi:uncharacterized protein